VLDQKEIQEALESPPEQGAVNNINRHVHIGAAPQRPYAALEDRMAQNRGWASFGDIPKDAGIKKGDDGGYYRVVQVGTGRQVEKGGKLYNVVRTQRRGVALSLEAAQAASQNGSPTDYYDGSGWIRGGRKREYELASAVGTEFAEELELVEAAPEDQAVHSQRRAALAAAAPAVAQAPKDVKVSKEK
jgi:hypothetical protein